MKERLVEIASSIGGAGAALTSTAASICCIGPAGIAILGVNGAILAAGLKPYRPYLLAASAVLIGAAFWGVYGRWRGTDSDACPARVGRVVRGLLWGSVALWLVALAIGFLADRYWL